MSGDVDYLLHVVVPDIAAYDDFYRKLIAPGAAAQRQQPVQHGTDEGGAAADLIGDAGGWARSANAFSRGETGFWRCNNLLLNRLWFDPPVPTERQP